MSKESDLIGACIKGDRQAQRALYDRYAPRLMVVCLRYSKAQQEAEDILQESFIKIFDKLKDFRLESQLGYWMKRIVVNTALNHQRSKLYMFPMHDLTDVPTGDSQVDVSEMNFKELLVFIQQLPTGCQIIFNMYAIEGYTHKEIAKELNVSEGTSKSQYSRARHLLQDLIRKEEKLSYGI